MKKSLWNNGLFLSLLTAVLFGAFAFWRSTETKLAVQDTRITALEKQAEKLGNDLDELARMLW